MPYNLVDRYQHVRELCCLHLQGQTTGYHIPEDSNIMNFLFSVLDTCSAHHYPFTWLEITTLCELHYYRIPYYVQFPVLYLTSLMFTCLISFVSWFKKKYITWLFHQWVIALLYPKEINIPWISGAVCHLFCLVKLELNLCVDINKVSFLMIISSRLGSRTISSAICGEMKLQDTFWRFPKTVHILVVTYNFPMLMSVKSKPPFNKATWFYVYGSISS